MRRVESRFGPGKIQIAHCTGAQYNGDMMFGMQEETVMGLFGKKSFFPYVGEIGSDVMEEIRRTVARAQGILGLSDGTGGRETAAAINEMVDRILENGVLPEGFADLEDAAVCLGVLVGHALCVGQQWKWKALGENAGNASFCVVSPGDYFSNAPMPYLLRILFGNNRNVDGTNDNTVLLLYNMLENIDRKPEKQKYFPVA